MTEASCSISATAPGSRSRREATSASIQATPLALGGAVTSPPAATDWHSSSMNSGLPPHSRARAAMRSNWPHWRTISCIRNGSASGNQAATAVSLADSSSGANGSGRAMRSTASSSSSPLRATSTTSSACAGRASSACSVCRLASSAHCQSSRISTSVCAPATRPSSCTIAATRLLADGAGLVRVEAVEE